MSDEVAVSAPAAAEAPSSEAPEQAAEGQETAEPAKKKTPPAFRKYKISDTEEVSLTDEDIARDLKKWRGADKAFREAAQARKSVEDFKTAFESDPEKILNDPRLSFDRRKLAEKWLLESLEAEVNPADPRDLKLAEYERKVKEFEERDAKEAQEKADREHNEAREQRRQVISQQLAEAMQATHLSQHPETAASVLREMALYMRAGKERGVDISPQEIVEHIHNARFHQMYTLAHAYEGEELVEFLGEEVVNRIRKADLARLRKAREAANQHKDESWAPADKSAAPAKMDMITARRHADKMLR